MSVRSTSETTTSTNEVRTSNRRADQRLAWAASSCVLASAALYSFLLPLTPSRLAAPSRALFDEWWLWQWWLESRPVWLDDPRAVAVLILVTAGLGFAGCFGGVALAWFGRASVTRRFVLGTAAVAIGFTVVAPPTWTTNPYNYMLRARVASAYGENPYATAAGEFPEDPFTRFAKEEYTRFPGGKLPAWMSWNVAVSRLSGDSVVANLLLLRISLGGLGLASLFLLSGAARALASSRASAGLLLIAWNPVMLSNVATRTDTVTLFWLAVAITLLAAGRRRLSWAALTISVFVKMLTLPLLAVAALSEIRSGRWGELGRGTLIVLVTSAVVWSPFLPGLSVDVVASYTYVVRTSTGTADGQSFQWAVPIAFAAVILATGLRRTREPRDVLLGWTTVQLFFSVFLAKFASADYLFPMLALVAVTTDVRAVVLAMALSVSFHLFDVWYLIGSSSFVLPDLFDLPRPVVFGIPLACVLVGWGIRRLVTAPPRVTAR